MLKPTLTQRDVVNLINQLIEIDPVAMKHLINARVTCNKTLADHPTVQVGTDEAGLHQVGLMGILNGLFGTIQHDGRGARNFTGYGPFVFCQDEEDPERIYLGLAEEVWGMAKSFVVFNGQDTTLHYATLNFDQAQQILGKQVTRFKVFTNTPGKETLYLEPGSPPVKLKDGMIISPEY